MKTSRSASGITTRKIGVRTPVSRAMNSRIMPYWLIVSKAEAKVSGSRLSRMWMPSSGGIGSRLKTASPMFSVKKT